MTFHSQGRPAARGPVNIREKAARGLLILAILLVASVTPIPLAADELLFETGNDFLTSSNKDDLYTFSTALTLNLKGTTLRLRENAFTDRETGLRFDETYLTARRPLPIEGPWALTLEAGGLHVGEGLLGEEAQNAVHDAIGDDEVHLEYVENTKTTPFAKIEAGRWFRGGALLAWGPHLEASTAPGFKTQALAALRGDVDLLPWLRIESLAGLRFVDTSYGPLAQRVDAWGATADIVATINDRVAISWSYNQYGTRQEHLSLAYLFRARTGIDRRPHNVDLRETQEAHVHPPDGVEATASMLPSSLRAQVTGSQNGAETEAFR